MRVALVLVLGLALLACKSKVEKAREAVDEGNAKLTAKDLEGADASFLRALEHVPDDPPALAGRGKVALAKDDPERARSLLAKCGVAPCIEVRAEAAKQIRERLAQGSLEGAEGTRFIDLAIESTDIGCGLLLSMLVIEERDKKGTPAPASFVADVK